MNENIALMKQLAIISPHNPDFSDKISTYESIYRMKGEVASSIKFVISNESDKDVVNTLKSLLTSKSFKIAESGDYKFTISHNMPQDKFINVMEVGLVINVIQNK